MQLLRADPVELPLLGVEVSIVAAYAIAPFLFVILHANLMVQYVLLAERVNNFNQSLTCLSTIEKDTECKRLFPLPFLTLATIRGPHGLVQYLLHMVVWISLVGMPSAALLWTQIKFLPYQHTYLTPWHQILIIFDVVIILLFLPKLMAVFTKTSSHPNRYWALTVTWQGVVLILTLFLAVHRPLGWILVSPNKPFVHIEVFPIPEGLRLAQLEMDGFRPLGVVLRGEDKPFENDTEADEFWLDTLLRVDRRLDVQERILMLREPDPAIYVRYREEAADHKYDPSENAHDSSDYGDQKARLDGDHAEPLDLRDRNFRFANFTGTRFPRALIQNANFNHATFVGAHLPGADLEDAWMQSANFKQAQLQNANIRQSKMQGASFDNANMEGAILIQAELQGAFLRGASLQGANFQEAQLQGASLRAALLTEANLRLAQLQDSNLGQARLEGADLSQAQLQAANLGQANLQRANLGQAELGGTNLWTSQLQGANLELAQLQGANLRSALLQGANLGGANLKGANLVSARLQGSNLGQAELEGAMPDEAHLQAAFLGAARLEGADLSSAQLQGADLTAAQIQGADLRNAQLQGVFLKAAQLQGADLRNTIWYNSFAMDSANWAMADTSKRTSVSIDDYEVWLDRILEGILDPGVTNRIESILSDRIQSVRATKSVPAEGFLSEKGEIINSDDFERDYWRPLASYLMKLICREDLPNKARLKAGCENAT